MALPNARHDPGYPYEHLTSKEIADIQRMRDKQMAKLRHDNRLLREEIYALNTWRKRLMPLLEEMGVDPDVLIATDKALKDQRPWHTQ
jgi:hypothetical protein